MSSSQLDLLSSRSEVFLVVVLMLVFSVCPYFLSVFSSCIYLLGCVCNLFVFVPFFVFVYCLHRIEFLFIFSGGCVAAGAPAVQVLIKLCTYFKILLEKTKFNS